MSLPLAAIGSAILEVIGLNPQSFDDEGEGIWAMQPVFDAGPFYQPTGPGERVLTISLAARPHVMGGLAQYEALRGHMRRQEVVPYIRLVGPGIAGRYQIGRFVGEVAVRRVSQAEGRLSPYGIGYRHEFEAELIFPENRFGGF